VAKTASRLVEGQAVPVAGRRPASRIWRIGAASWRLSTSEYHRRCRMTGGSQPRKAVGMSETQLRIWPGCSASSGAHDEEVPAQGGTRCEGPESSRRQTNGPAIRRHRERRDAQRVEGVEASCPDRSSGSEGSVANAGRGGRARSPSKSAGNPGGPLPDPSRQGQSGNSRGSQAAKGSTDSPQRRSADSGSNGSLTCAVRLFQSEARSWCAPGESAAGARWPAASTWRRQPEIRPKEPSRSSNSTGNSSSFQGRIVSCKQPFQTLLAEDADVRVAVPPALSPKERLTRSSSPVKRLVHSLVRPHRHAITILFVVLHRRYQSMQLSGQAPL